jgi:hypothetical protein
MNVLFILLNSLFYYKAINWMEVRALFKRNQIDSASTTTAACQAAFIISGNQF